MEEKRFPGGVWPVMLTPLPKENQVDYAALKENGGMVHQKWCDGLFAVCQSSEMFKLTLKERVTAAAKKSKSMLQAVFRSSLPTFQILWKIRSKS